MSILDILGSGPVASILNAMTGQGGQTGSGGLGGIGSGLGGLGAGIGNVLNSLAGQSRAAADNINQNVPGGMGGLVGAGALAAVLGHLMSGNAVKGVALAGAGAVAYNFYKKWAASQAQAAQPQDPTAGARQSHAQFGDNPQELPPADRGVAELITRAMIYAARADGQIQPEEKARIDAVIKALLPGQHVESIITQVSSEPLDPASIARSVTSPEQGEDVYRLSCSTIDIDHFMERSYLDALAKALNISPAEQKVIEAEASEAKKRLQAAIPA